MAPPDDDIPDLFPAGRGAPNPPQAPRRVSKKAPPAPAARPSQGPPARQSKRPGSLMPAAKARPKPPQAPSHAPEEDAVRSSRLRPELSTGLELDSVDPISPTANKQTLIGGSPMGGAPDELEFDPVSQRQPSFPPLESDEQEFGDSSDGVGGELELDLSSGASASMPPVVFDTPPGLGTDVPVSAQSAQTPSQGAQTLVGGSEAALGGSSVDLGLDLASPEPASPPAAPPQKPLSSPPSAPAEMSLSSPSAARPAQAPGKESVPALDVPSLSPQPAVSPSQAPPPQDLSALPGLEDGGALGGGGGLDPLGGAGMGNFPGMGNDVDLGGGLDDLGGAAAAQLNVGVPMADKEEDVPWPTGVTPVGDELAVSLEEAKDMSGFGEAPEGFLQSPMYALRVFTALRGLREKVDGAEKRLEEVEQARDEKLAKLAQSLRAELSGKDRFTALYAEIDRHDESISHKKRALGAADVDGAQVLRDVQSKIETEQATRLSKQGLFDQRRLIYRQAEQTYQRHQAGLKRIQIQWRNVESQAQKFPGDEMPDELDAQLDVLEQQREMEKKGLAVAKEQLQAAKKMLKEAEDEVRLVNAAIRRVEGEKEGLLMAYEGDIAQHSRDLDQAQKLRLEELTKAGRAIIDLRGEVKVDVETRKDLLAADATVEVAARQAETARMALATMDSEAYANGKGVWIAGVVAITLLLFWAAIA